MRFMRCMTSNGSAKKRICFFFSIYDTINVILKTTVLRFCFTVLFYRSKNFGGIL